jgi:hypothetical protein
MIIELNTAEALLVAGGNIIDEIVERNPFGEWCGNSYVPRGIDAPWGPGGCGHD